AHQRVATDKARNELAAAEAEYEKLERSIDLAHRQAQAKLKTAEASRARIPSTVQVDSLRKQVELAQRRLELTTIRAPSDGVILKLWLSEGETLAQQPILQMADTSRMVAAAEIYEDDALRIKPGETATIKGDALGEPIDGHVTYVGRLVAKNTVVGLTPTAATDLRVVEARILLDSNELASKLINLQVTVYIPALAGAESSDQPAEQTAQQAKNP
ncbi:MAG TPA: efflux RND transporter periplasmic adaptor subunit, partial [Pirellulales bacterium]|nr:efflux RND transporter periplasmic adaptor subunit [Pirellulales bacterium]